MVNFTIFNELSLPFSDCYNIENNLLDFLDILRRLQEDFAIQKIRFEKTIQELYICKDLSFIEYFNTIENKELKAKMRMLFSNHLVENPLISDNELESMGFDGDDYLNSIYKFQGKIISDGLACCILFDTLAISFNSAEKWNKAELSLEKNNKEKKVKHVSKMEHIKYHKNFFDELENDILKDITPKNLYSQLNILFPNLKFAKEIKKQTVKLPNDINFNKILKIFNKLNKDPKYLKDLNVSPEGETVKNSEKLRKQRIFTFGEEKIFCEKHIKNFDSLRIHFEVRNNTIFIGYIGEHLSNKNDP